MVMLNSKISQPKENKIVKKIKEVISGKKNIEQRLCRKDKVDIRVREGWKVIDVEKSNLDIQMKKNINKWNDLVLIEKEI